jgi:hypothetical protein
VHLCSDLYVAARSRHCDNLRPFSPASSSAVGGPTPYRHLPTNQASQDLRLELSARAAGTDTDDAYQVVAEAVVQLLNVERARSPAACCRADSADVRAVWERGAHWMPRISAHSYPKITSDAAAAVHTAGGWRGGPCSGGEHRHSMWAHSKMPPSRNRTCSRCRQSGKPAFCASTPRRREKSWAAAGKRLL